VKHQISGSALKVEYAVLTGRFMMLGSVNLFVNGYFSVPALLIIQILNPLCVILVPWFLERSVVRPACAAEG
jgi:hypothetical protein